MGLKTSFLRTLRLRYSHARIQWLTLAIAGMAIITFSSQELWARNTRGLCYTVNLPMFYLYAVFFISVILYANIRDYQKICNQRITSISCALISIVIDLGLLSLSEFFILLTINQLSTDLLKSLSCIFLIVFPLSLGEVALSSLTTEYLRKRAEKLRNEISKLRKEATGLEKGRKEGEKRLVELKKKIEKFEKILEKKPG